MWVCHAETALTAFDPKTLAVKATPSSCPVLPKGSRSTRGKRLFVNCLKPATVAVVDAEKGEVVAKYPLAPRTRNYPLALDRGRGRVFVGCREKPMVVALDAKTGKELLGSRRSRATSTTCSSTPSGSDSTPPAATASWPSWRSGTGASRSSRGSRPGSWRRTCLFDPAGRLFVILPRADDRTPPELRVYRPAD